ncbi:MAG: nitrate- and nitrite sensing domain-containing protein, partial [Rhodospirillales bacterium]|nr:nitrate- and nitrite sensing domain-containing protein [Rhodospirillales bacterium]
MNHLRIGTRILLALALPVLGLLAVAGYVVLEKQRLLVEAQALRQLVSFAGEVGTLVHQLQLERGQSTVFVSAPDLPADDIHAQWRASDDSRQRFRALGQAFLRRQLDPSLGRHLGIALSDLKGIDALRQRIGDRLLSPLATVQTYTLTINRLLDLAGQLPALSSDGRISGLAAAYVSLLQGKERAGRERAIGAGLFGTRDRDAEAYRLFVALGAQQHAFFTDFRGFATSELVAMLDEGLESGQDEFHRMRATVLDSVVTGHFGTVTAAEWFAVATRRIDRLRDV